MNLNANKNQTTNVINVLNILRDRELGYVKTTKSNKFMLMNYGYNLTDKMLLSSLNNLNNPPEYKPVVGLQNEFGSIYSVDFSSNGALASVSDTKRSVSFINLHRMTKIGQINNFKRTAWTMAFHPVDSGIIAFGCFGGQVNVFKNFELYRLAANDEITGQSPISSLTFHPVKFYILYAQKNSLTVWDWENNVILHRFESKPKLYIRYIKSIPFSNRLITGIEFPSLKLSEMDKLPIEMESVPDKLSFLLNLLNNFIFDFEASCENDLLSVLRQKFEYLTKLLEIFIKSHKTDMALVSQYSKSNMSEINKSLDIINNRLKFIIKSSMYYESYVDYVDLINSIYQSELNITESNFNSRLHVSTIYEIMNQLNQFIQMIEEKNDDNPWHISEIHTIVMANNNYVIQVWDFDDPDNEPDLKQNWRNTITSSYILNDSTLAISCCGKMLCSFIEVLSPNNFKTTITIHSLAYSNLGDCLFKYDLNCLKTLSVSFSSSNSYLMIGVRSEHIYAYILNIYTRKINVVHIKKDKNKKSDINCIKWAPRPSDGILIGFQDNLQLRYLKHCT